MNAIILYTLIYIYIYINIYVYIYIYIYTYVYIYDHTYVGKAFIGGVLCLRNAREMAVGGETK